MAGVCPESGEEVEIEEVVRVVELRGLAGCLAVMYF